MKRISFLAFATLLFLISCNENVGTTITFTGVVSDIDTQAPLAGVTIMAQPMNLGGETNSEGRYSFSLPRTDAQAYLLFELPGYDSYQTQSMSLSPKGVKEYTIDARLQSRIAKAQLSSTTVDFGDEQTTVTLQLSNPGTDTLRWTFMDMYFPSWLKVEPLSGVLKMKESLDVVFTVDRSSLELGEQQATIQLLGGEAPLDVLVKMAKRAAILQVKNTSFDFSEEDSTAQTQIYNLGNKTLEWSLADALPGWISWSSVAGNVAAGDSALVQIRVDRSPLDFGAHAFTTRLLSSGGEASYSFALTKTRDLVEVAPQGLDFGSAALTRQFTVSRLSGVHPVPFTVSSEDTCLSFSALEGSITKENASEVITVTLDRDHAPVGVHNSTIHVAAADQQFTLSASYSIAAPVVLATVTTLEKTFDKEFRIYLNGQLESNGGGSVTEHGHCWHTEGEPTLENGKCSQMGDLSVGESFTTLFEEKLSQGVTFYYRAYATNEVGTAYGEIKEIHYQPINLAKPTLSSSGSTLTCRSSVTGLADQQITQHGFCWSREPQPILNEGFYNNLGAKASNGNITSSFTNMLRGYTYYARAYAINASGLFFSEESSLEIAIQEPILITGMEAENTGLYQATLSGDLTRLGSEPIIQHGFCWGIQENPTVEGLHSQLGALSSTGVFSQEVKSLIINTKYHFRAYVQTERGIYYGGDSYFETLTDASIVATDSLKMYLTVDENMNPIEWTGHAPDMVVSSGVTLNPNNKPSGARAAFSFNGSSGYMLMPNYCPLSEQNRGTINFWVRMRSTMSKSLVYPLFGSISEGGFYVELRHNGTDWVMTLCLGPGQQTFTMVLPSVASIDISSLLGTDWHMLSIASDGTTTDIYLDGTKLATQQLGMRFGKQSDFVIGANALDGKILNTFMAADLACVRFYNIMLNSSAISVIYKAGM